MVKKLLDFGFGLKRTHAPTHQKTHNTITQNGWRTHNNNSNCTPIYPLLHLLPPHSYSYTCSHSYSLFPISRSAFLSLSLSLSPTFARLFSDPPVVFVQVGGQKKELRPVESLATSPKHRASISTVAALSVELPADRTDGGRNDDSTSIVAPGGIQHQHSLDQSVSTSIRQVESSQFDVDLVMAEPLEKILDHKSVREKRLEMEKKLESLRKKHDKEKVKIAGQKMSPLEGKKPKFAITNKLVKRLSNKSL